MIKENRPYLVCAELVEQPTWGGGYIAVTKGWENRDELRGIRIGQSFELYGGTELFEDVLSTDDKRIEPVFFRKNTIAHPYKTKPLSVFVKKGIPLIKFTQAAGNSFQVHRKPQDAHPHWQPKAESWYYFETGCLTFGLRKGISIEEYKQVCLRIETFMKDLSQLVKKGSLLLDTAKQRAAVFVHEENPWRFVNKHYVQDGAVIDLSGGGVHHSWEEDVQKCPQGNIVYEVQEDVQDEFCTMRAFDQGRISKNGDVRPVHIDDYFSYIDTDPDKNTLKLKRQNEIRLIQTKHYTLDVLRFSGTTKAKTEGTFHHLFVKTGRILVEGGGVKLQVGRGHSCFVPEGCLYTLSSVGETVVLQTSV